MRKYIKYFFLSNIIFVLLAAVFQPAEAQKRSLRVLTINVWSGLDYKGFFFFGEYETAERRELRFQSLLTQIKMLKPDLIFIQEANPVRYFSSRIADSLGFDEIHQVRLGGIKLGPLGIPFNLKEGISIVADPSLNLQNYEVRKLSGSFGIFADQFIVHFDESIFTLIGKIVVDGTPLYLANVHLSSSVPEDSVLEKEYYHLLAEKKITDREFNETTEEWREKMNQREDETDQLLEAVGKLPADAPLLVAGDFNATPNSNEIIKLQKQGNLIDVLSEKNPETSQVKARQYTWDFSRNGNIAYSTNLTDSRGDSIRGYERLNALYDERSRRIDYIFLNRQFSPGDVIDRRIVLDSAVNGVYPSDHFGIYSEIDLGSAALKGLKESKELSRSNETTFEPLPIISYDTDVGFGYGLKAFLLNYLNLNESFDAVAFNSSKGERWYRFVFSVPDIELRQGKIYALAADITVDYDKWINYNFFGIGNDTKYADKEIYTREPLEISLTLSRGFSPYFVGQLGFKYKSVFNTRLPENSRLKSSFPSTNSSKATFLSLTTIVRYDTRDSYINPSHGFVLQGETEFAPKTRFTNTGFGRLGLWTYYYSTFIGYPKTTLALRFGLQQLSGRDLPVQVLLPIGGGSTLRGYTQDRFLDKFSALANAELRFPVFWRFGGVAGYDFGKVWSKISMMGLRNWALNPTLGLRFYFDTFIVRLDVGLGRETTGFYLNFGHMFS